jgi:hypothetical protein
MVTFKVSLLEISAIKKMARLCGDINERFYIYIVLMDDISQVSVYINTVVSI